MLPVLVPDVPVYAGDTVDFPSYTFQGDDEEVLDVSGYSWAAQWRPFAEAKDSKAINLVVDDSDAADGIIRVQATAEDTTAMGGDGVWDLQAIDGDRVTTWLRGNTVFTKDVTRV